MMYELGFLKFEKNSVNFNFCVITNIQAFNDVYRRTILEKKVFWKFSQSPWKMPSKEFSF